MESACRARTCATISGVPAPAAKTLKRPALPESSELSASGQWQTFGIAEELHVETEDIRARERTVCSAFRSTLSVTEDCISFDPQSATGSPGTRGHGGHASPTSPIQVDEARAYISQFVAYLPIDVFVNGSKASGLPIEESVPHTFEQNMDCGGAGRGSGAAA